MRHYVYALLSLPLSWYILQVFSKPLFDEARNQKRDSESGNIVKYLLFRLRPIFLCLTGVIALYLQFTRTEYCRFKNC